MIDLHSHVLPGIDDGARTEADSLAIARAAVTAGVTAIAATPHLRVDHPGVVPSQLARRCAELQGLLDAERVSLEVIPGGELDIHWAQTASDEELRLVSYGQIGSWLLVETPYGEVSELFEELLFTLSARGFDTLLAHPERNPSFQRHPERLHALVERGALLQLTAHALVTAARRAPHRRLAEALVRDSLAHVIASDVHRASGRRGIGLAEASAAADALVPGAGAYMTRDAPAAIVAGERPMRPPQRSGRGESLVRRLGRLRS
jgi:protein-tyrosine phosphatase